MTIQDDSKSGKGGLSLVGVILFIFLACVVLYFASSNPGVIGELITGMKPPPFDPANPNNLPIPTDAGLIDWLTGTGIVVEKGIISDTKWTIEKGEVSDFHRSSVTLNGDDHMYSVTFSFKAIAGGQGISVGGAIIRYWADSSQNLHFVDFTPGTVTRFGN